MVALRKRRPVRANQHLFGWCSEGLPGVIPMHEKHDENGKRVHGTCPGTLKSIADTANYSKNTPIYCQCPCHLQFQEDPTAPRPEPWPGYVPPIAIVEEPEDEENAGSSQEAESGVSTDSAPEVLSETPAASGVSSEPKPAGLHDLPELENVSRQIWYKEGWVLRVLVSEPNRKGDMQEFIKWAAYRFGEQIALEWSLKVAKAALLEEATKER